jgi:hypothetical protein
VKQIDLNQFKNEFKLTIETMRFYCTNRFYTLLAFANMVLRGILFVVFGSRNRNI